MLGQLVCVGVLHTMQWLCTGTAANDVHFQAYLLEGVMRWNDDRAVAAVSSDGTTSRCYSGSLRAAVNQLSDRILGEKLDSGFHPAKAYTGMYCRLAVYQA